MADLMLGGTVINIAPFMLREMRQAASHIDHVTAARAATTKTMESSAEVIHSVTLALCVGIRRSILDGRLSPDLAERIPMTRSAALSTQLDQICDWVEGQMGMGAMGELNRCFFALMEESGMRKSDSDPTRGVPAPREEQSLS